VQLAGTCYDLKKFPPFCKVRRISQVLSGAMWPQLQGSKRLPKNRENSYE